MGQALSSAERIQMTKIQHPKHFEHLQNWSFGIV